RPEFALDQGKIIFDGQFEKIVRKFADYKILSLVLADKVDSKKLEKIGKLKEFDFPKVTIVVKRAVAPLAAAQALQEFPIADLNLEEPPIKEILSQTLKTFFLPPISTVIFNSFSPKEPNKPIKENQPRGANQNCPESGHC
ncbi:unnamed protein product, partial [marine sediment metagenome]